MLMLNRLHSFALLNYLSIFYTFFLAKVRTYCIALGAHFTADREYLRGYRQRLTLHIENLFVLR